SATAGVLPAGGAFLDLGFPVDLAPGWAGAAAEVSAGAACKAPGWPAGAGGFSAGATAAESAEREAGRGAACARPTSAQTTLLASSPNSNGTHWIRFTSDLPPSDFFLEPM